MQGSTPQASIKPQRYPTLTRLIVAAPSRAEALCSVNHEAQTASLAATNADVFANCGPPLGTVPTRDPCDRAHGHADACGLTMAARQCRPPLRTTPRRYGKANIDGQGLSIDSQEDRAHDAHMRLVSLGLQKADESRADNTRMLYSLLDSLPRDVRRKIIRQGNLTGALNKLKGAR